MENEIYLLLRQKDKIGNVMADEPIILIASQMPNVGNVSRDQIVDRDNTMSFSQQSVGQMRAEKSGAPGYNGNGFNRCRHGGVFFVAASRKIASRKQLEPDLSFG
jgi:hypothetical protein